MPSYYTTTILGGDLSLRLFARWGPARPGWSTRKTFVHTSHGIPHFLAERSPKPGSGSLPGLGWGWQAGIQAGER